ncbi:MAG: tetratricopeptide repeat protein, partial [Methylocella sp.]
MPSKLKFAEKDHGRRCRCRALRGFAVLLLLALTFPAVLASAQARTRENLAIAAPFEVGESPSGNYLAALVAGSERDTVAAATFFREALRSDPRNPNLIERAFVAAVSNGNMQDAFDLADRLRAHDPNNSLARLALGVKAIKAKRFAAARAYFAKGGTGLQRYINASLM